MRRLLRRRYAAPLLIVMMMSSSLSTSTAFAADSLPAAVHAIAGWTYYATYPDYASCVAAGRTNAQGRSWKCVSSAPGAFDLYVLA
jgi:hypothetical protein